MDATAIVNNAQCCVRHARGPRRTTALQQHRTRAREASATGATSSPATDAVVHTRQRTGGCSAMVVVTEGTAGGAAGVGFSFLR